MSIRLMSAAWDLDLPQTEKMVLLALCDHANDDGFCWPSMGRLARRCGVSDRTIRNAMNRLEDQKIVKRHGVAGRANHFQIDPGKICTPEADSAPPRKEVPDTPERRSAKPSITVNEPSNETARVPKPDEVSDGVWRDFKDHRRKHGGITPTVIAGFRREAERAGYSLEEAMAESITQGWRGFKADWVKKHGNGPANDEIQNPYARAATRRQADRAASGA